MASCYAGRAKPVPTHWGLAAASRLRPQTPKCSLGSGCPLLEYPFLKPSIPPPATLLTATGRGQRRAPRLEVEIAGTLLGRVSHPVRLLDLSATGCLLRCETLLEPGVILDLRVTLGEQPFEAKARVVDSSLDGSEGALGPSGSLTSLQFLGLAARDDASLRQFLEGERRRRRSADAPAE
jgi:hypothetical protein